MCVYGTMKLSPSGCRYTGLCWPSFTHPGPVEAFHDKNQTTSGFAVCGCSSTSHAAAARAVAEMLFQVKGPYEEGKLFRVISETGYMV